MIEANELRIGNMVAERGNHRVYNVAKILESDIEVIYWSCGETEKIPINKLVPIIITPEILEKSGFVKNKEFGDSWVIKTKTGEIILSDDYVLQSTDTVTKLNYVHQLQNLYFALTGKELEVNL